MAERLNTVPPRPRRDVLPEVYAFGGGLQVVAFAGRSGDRTRSLGSRRRRPRPVCAGNTKSALRRAANGSLPGFDAQRTPEQVNRPG